MTIAQDVQKLEPGKILEFFELDGTGIGGSTVRFHPYNHGNVIWEGDTYAPWPVKGEGFARTSAQQPQPRFSVGNIDGSISFLCLAFEDMVGAVLTRKRTFMKYLDAANWPDVPVAMSGGSATGAWTYLAGVIVRNSASANYARANHTVLDPSKTYRLTFDVTTFASDNVFVFVGGAASPNYEITSNGSKIINIAPGTAGSLGYVEFSSAGGFPGEIRIANMVLIEVGVGNATADPTQQFPQEIWFVERKAEETPEVVTFELASALDFGDIKLPRRQIIANQCPYVYRGPLCNYVGAPVATALDVPTVNALLDKCSRKLTGCKLRQWPDGVLNFGGFPAADLTRT